MFTGIINHLGIFVKRVQNEFMFTIPPQVAKQITTSSSIAIDGVCLTVKRKKTTTVYVDVMGETLKKTILGTLKAATLVNLELPVTLNTLFSGHIVQGHIDGIGKLESIKKEDNSYILKFSIPKDLSKYIVHKGSIAVNGISLTVIKANTGFFTVGIIPFTWTETMLHTLQVGDYVNIELDLLTKIVEKLLKNNI